MGVEKRPQKTPNKPPNKKTCLVQPTSADLTQPMQKEAARLRDRPQSSRPPRNRYVKMTASDLSVSPKKAAVTRRWVWPDGFPRKKTLKAI